MILCFSGQRTLYMTAAVCHLRNFQVPCIGTTPGPISTRHDSNPDFADLACPQFYLKYLDYDSLSRNIPARSQMLNAFMPASTKAGMNFLCRKITFRTPPSYPVLCPLSYLKNGERATCAFGKSTSYPY